MRADVFLFLLRPCRTENPVRFGRKKRIARSCNYTSLQLLACFPSSSRFAVHRGQGSVPYAKATSNRLRLSWLRRFGAKRELADLRERKPALPAQARASQSNEGREGGEGKAPSLFAHPSRPPLVAAVADAAGCVAAFSRSPSSSLPM